jgi:cell wall-associated NlpC family hydrolase
VFYNTMRRSNSHVGIYLGDGQFVHSPSTGKSVTVANMNDSYWRKRYNGARRINP